MMSCNRDRDSDANGQRKRRRQLPQRDHNQDELNWTGFEGAEWVNEWLRDQRAPMVMTQGAAEWVRPSKADMTKAFKAAPVGKKLPDSLYVHVTAIDTLPDLLYRQLDRANDIAGEAEYDLAKINRNGTVVSLLSYPTFMDDPHPALANAITVNLETGAAREQDYSQRQSPPILHRKESFLDPGHPQVGEFKKLTQQEEQHHLLNQPGIGTRGKWEDLLVEKNIMIEDHQVRQAMLKYRGHLYRVATMGHQEAIDVLRDEDYGVDDNPDLMDVIHTTSPRMDRESARLQERYWQLRQDPESVELQTRYWKPRRGDAPPPRGKQRDPKTGPVHIDTAE